MFVSTTCRLFFASARVIKCSTEHPSFFFGVEHGIRLYLYMQLVWSIALGMNVLFTLDTFACLLIATSEFT